VRRYLSLVLVPLTVIGLGAIAAVPGHGAAASAATTSARPLTLYLAPSSRGGSDRHTGLTKSSPVLTLARAQQVLEQRKPTGDVTVRIEQGTYVAGQTTWQFYVPGHTISFMPANYVVGHGRPAGGDPAFVDATSHGKHVAGWWFHAQLPGSGSSLHDGGNTGLRFYYLHIVDYTNGISLDGQTGHAYHNNAKPPLYTKPSAGLNGNDVSGMTFSNIGDAFAPGQTGYGAILFTDSSGDDISNNTFDDLYNTGDQDELHALYVTHFSSNNTISRNLFENTNGEAVKVRDRSDFNNVSGNRFDHTGGIAAYLDIYCNLQCAVQSPPTPRQCANFGNRFAGNTVETGEAWAMIPSGQTNAGGPGCSLPRGQQRLHTAGNH
jgi:hypothetical protein